MINNKRSEHIIEKLGNIVHKLKISNGHRLTDTALKNTNIFNYDLITYI